MASRGMAAGLLLALAASGCVDPRDRSDPPILRLGDQTIRRSDFQHHLQSLEDRGIQTEDPQLRTALLEAFLEERVLVLEARRRGLLKPGASPDDEETAVRKIVREAALARGQPTEKDLETAYKQHSELCEVPETVTLRHILVRSMNEARDVRRRLNRDPKNFEILARTLSRSPEASSGGLLGTFQRGELPPELEKAAFELAPGNASAIVATPHGFHVIRVDSHEPGRVKSLEECRPALRAKLAEETQEEATRDLVKALLAEAKVNHEAAQDTSSRP
jgi:peptidyl-prolyl cis-trans isomerase C